MKPEEIINAITEQIDLLNQQPLEDFSGDTLTRIGVRLASYKAGLGRYSKEAKRATRVAEHALKRAKATEYKRLRDAGTNSTDSSELRILGVEKEYNAHIDALELEDGIVSLSFNVHDLIDSIKSRVINVQMERSESNGH